MDDITRCALQEAGWTFPDWAWDCLSEYEQEFVRKEFTGQRSLDYYRARLEALGFRGMERVLDAACGMGQWTVALSALNGHVNGVDINMERLLLSKLLADGMGADNCTFRYGLLEKLPFEREYFDGIFCCGAFMFTDMPTTLSEFHRTLKPDGKIYLNANNIGWYAHLLLDRGLKQRNFSIMKSALRIIAATMLGRTRNIVVTKKWLMRHLESAGLRVLAVGAEGEISIGEPIEKPEPAYPQSYYGMPALIEVLAQKRER